MKLSYNIFSRLLSLLFFITIGVQTNAQTTSIPDPNFEQALIDLGIDSDGVINGEVLTSDIENIITLEVPDYEISNLTGIEDFIALEHLNIRLNLLSSVDISSLINLRTLDCLGNNLAELNVSSNLLLEELVLRANNISNIDLSNNTALVILNLSYNNLTSLDIAQNTSLENLDVMGCNLSTLDISNNTELKILNCSVNPLNSIDLTSNTHLTHLYAQVIHTISDSSIDLSNNGILEYVNIDDTWLTYLDVSNNPELKTLMAGGNSLSEIDLSNNLELEYLDVSNNSLTELDLSNCIQLKELYCTNYGGFYELEISSLDLSNNPNLELFYGENLYSLENLNLKNENNSILTVELPCEVEGFPCKIPLNCVEVDDEEAASNNQPPYSTWYIAANFIYSEDCSLHINDTSQTIITLYPNPTTTTVIIEGVDTAQVEVFSLSGKKVLETYNTNTLNVSNLPTGMYLLKIHGNNSIITQKLLVF